MSFGTIVDVATLAAHLDDPDWAIVDCRHSLADPGRGQRAYNEAHIPGAVHADLDQHLSGPILPGETGRHPLPAIDTFAARLGSWGIDEGVQVIAYDDMGGAIAARLWWMLRWLGHDAVAVLDGGFTAWTEAEQPTREGAEIRPTRSFTPRPRPERVVDAAAVNAAREATGTPVFDARGPTRYRGEEEPIDPVAGHIPGARSLPFDGNLDLSQRLRPVEELRARFEAALGEARPADAIFYCGSGVTACHNLLAMAHAGLEGARLYPGSWSEWIIDESRPVAIGD